VKGFRHRTLIRVRNYEVDWQGIVHNAVYLQYFETGRFEYLRRAGIDPDNIQGRRHYRVVLARNEVDYLLPSRFDDLLAIHTKVSMIGTTSFIFEGVIRNVKTKKCVSKNLAVHVWLGTGSGKPCKIPRGFISKIERFEGGKIIRKSP
jgi:acyl-CoA thioester hydrolase